MVGGAGQGVLRARNSIALSARCVWSCVCLCFMDMRVCLSVLLLFACRGQVVVPGQVPSADHSDWQHAGLRAHGAVCGHAPRGGGHSGARESPVVALSHSHSEIPVGHEHKHPRTLTHASFLLSLASILSCAAFRRLFHKGGLLIRGAGVCCVCAVSFCTVRARSQPHHSVYGKRDGSLHRGCCARVRRGRLRGDYRRRSRRRDW